MTLGRPHSPALQLPLAGRCHTLDDEGGLSVCLAVEDPDPGGLWNWEETLGFRESVE